jgi:hypothetical protein
MEKNEASAFFATVSAIAKFIEVADENYQPLQEKTFFTHRDTEDTEKTMNKYLREEI